MLESVDLSIHIDGYILFKLIKLRASDIYIYVYIIQSNISANLLIFLQKMRTGWLSTCIYDTSVEM